MDYNLDLIYTKNLKPKANFKKNQIDSDSDNIIFELNFFGWVQLDFGLTNSLYIPDCELV